MPPSTLLETDQHQPSKKKAELLLLLVVFIWAANYPLAKYAFGGMDAFVFNAIRYIIATIVLFTILLRRASWVRVARRDWVKLLVAGVVASIVYQTAFIIGLSLTTAGNSAILLSTAPLWTMFINARMHKEKILPGAWIGMVLSLSGVAMIIIGSGKKFEFGSSELIGDCITLAAAAFWGLNTNLQKPLLQRYSAIQLAIIMIAIGAVGLSVIAIPAALTTPWMSLHWSYLLAAFFSGVFSIGFANVFWSYGVQRLGPGKTANFNNLVPVVAFVLSFFLLSEMLLPIQLAGAVVTIIGVWVARR